MQSALLKADAGESSGILTGEELYALGSTGCCELIEGNLISVSPTGYVHGIVEVRIAKILSLFVEKHQLGYVLGGEVGIYTRRNPDTVRGADVIFISKERLTQSQSRSWLDVAPELIVEILSPGDLWTEVGDKLEEYFSIGVNQVWIADPRRRQVFVYTSPLKAIRCTEKISAPDILPGFEADVADFFS